MIKDIIAYGFGFNPGSVKFIPTLGFTQRQLLPPDFIVIPRVKNLTWNPEQKLLTWNAAPKNTTWNPGG